VYRLLDVVESLDIRSVSHSIEAKAELEEEARLAKVEELWERASNQRRAASTEPDPTERKSKLTRPSRSEEKADPSHDYSILKDSQSESQKEIVPNRPSAKTRPATSLLPSRVYSVQAPRGSR